MAEADRYSEKAGTLNVAIRQGVDGAAPWPCKWIQFHRTTYVTIESDMFGS